MNIFGHVRQCFVAATHVNYFMSQPLVGMLNVLPDGVPTLLEEIFGFKHGTLLLSLIFYLDFMFLIKCLQVNHNTLLELQVCS